MERFWRMRGCFVAVALVVSFCFVAGAEFYQQEHLARTHNVDEMVVSWFTLGDPSSPKVQYYSNATKVVHTLDAQSCTFYAPAGYAHNALLKGLSPHTWYYYRVTTASSSWTPWYRFLTPHPVFSPFAIPIYGDMGVTQSDGTVKYVTALTDSVLANNGYFPGSKEQLPFILHVGDFSYADDRPSHLYEPIWNEFFARISNISRHYPYMVLPGNHEYQSGPPVLKYSQYFVDFNKRFLMPKKTAEERNGKAESDNMWWSMTHQNIHLLAIDTETDYTNAPYDHVHFGEQLDFVRKDLEKAAAARDRGEISWIIATGHRPLYSSANQSYIQHAIPPLQDAFEDLFHKYGVDVYFCGHVHSYERTYPVYHGKRQGGYHNPAGLVEIVVGGAGNMEGLVTNYVTTNEWSAKTFYETQSWGLLHVVSDKILKWELLSSADNSVVDSVEITKS
eukprot:TRINITY_DN11725_c0_g1_i2.p1 TRINITY_DN11725_c0_g1~~TRINITY_DN11725_c0_g1_i2.p1  ORF type:complete len:448 (+),score=66.84 TRINITY_DN11725_c0_g1_i2:102-1445(+)